MEEIKKSKWIWLCRG